jgi:hypothetical protein
VRSGKVAHWLRIRLETISLDGYPRGMTATLKAHYDGKAIQLDEPFPLSQAARLLVTVLEDDEESRYWSELGAEAFSRAGTVAEPEYTAADCIA